MDAIVDIIQGHIMSKSIGKRNGTPVNRSSLTNVALFNQPGVNRWVLLLSEIT
jgi:hypothetical protein